MTNTNTAPQPGTFVRPAGSELRFEVKSSHDRGCYAEATAECRDSLRGPNRRRSLALTEAGLCDSEWRAWEVCS